MFTLLLQTFCIEIAIFDAGSTATRLHVYSFDKNKLNEKSTALFPYALSLKNVHETIETLLPHVNDQTPIGFYATAGLRENPEGVQIIKEVKKKLVNHKLHEIKILSGTEEALGLLDAFEFFEPSLKKYQLLDMGGMSTQIVFKNNDDVKVQLWDTGIKIKRKINQEKTQMEKYENIFLFSVFADALKEFSNKTYKEIKDEIVKTCPINLKITKCDDLQYLTTFLDTLAIENTTKFKILQSTNNLYVSWPIGKALGIYRHNNENNQIIF